MKIQVEPVEVTVVTNVYVDSNGICAVKTMLLCGAKLLGEVQCIDNVSCSPERFLEFASTCLADGTRESHKSMFI